jgi:hypothetical protein
MTGSHGLLVPPPSPPRGAVAGERGPVHGQLRQQKGGSADEEAWDALHGGSRSDSTIFSPPSSPDSPLATTRATAVARGRRQLRRGSNDDGDFGAPGADFVPRNASTSADGSLEEEGEGDEEEEPASQETAAHALNDLLCEAQLPFE